MSIRNLFTKINQIGGGSYSVVYKAKNNFTGEIIALKKFLIYDEGISSDRLREMSILKLVGNHPNIINMKWYDKSKFKYISMPIYDFDLKTGILKGLFDRDKTTIRNISYQLLHGIHYLHSYGICHRDIKSTNIMIDCNNNIPKAILIDLGIGRRLDCLDRSCVKTQLICTLWYRAPEILMGDKNYSFEVDIWGIGCVMAEMIIGQPLFQGDCEINQLFLIFKTLGTPNENIWANVTKLSHYIIFPTFPCVFDEKFNIDTCDIDMVNLLKGLITMNPYKRIKSIDAINHKYFGNIDNVIINNNNNILDNLINILIPSLHHCMLNQNNINNKMRIELADRLYEVCLHWNLLISTYIRGICIFDRLCMVNKKISKYKCQLFGITCLWISAKMEELSNPNLDDLVYICNNIYTAEHVLYAEREILASIDLDIYFPITTDFISTYVNKDLDKNELKFILVYITFNINLLGYHPHILAYIACSYVNNQSYDLISLSDSKINCMKDMKKWLSTPIYKNIPDMTVLFNKYKNESFMKKYI